MARGRKKKLQPNNPDSFVESFADSKYPLRNRRSSMRVNLSYTTNLTDPNIELSKLTAAGQSEAVKRKSVSPDKDPSELNKKPRKKLRILQSNEESDAPANFADITVINARERLLARYNKTAQDPECVTLIDMNEKEQQLNKTCMELKSAIIYKTQAYFDKKTELAIKTSEVLSSGEGSPKKKVKEDLDKRSPSVRVDFGKNDQIIMSGDGKKKNPVQVSSMRKQFAEAQQLDNQASTTSDEDTVYSQSIASTPKKSRLDNIQDSSESKNDESMNIPVVRLFANISCHSDQDENDCIEPTTKSKKIISDILSDDSDSSCSDKEENENIISENYIRKDQLNDKLNEIMHNSKSDSKILVNSTFSTSPILSQGIKKPCLSLKQKMNKSLLINKLRPSIAAESFIKGLPTTCSTFIDKQEKVLETKESNEKNETIYVSDKSASNSNCKTIILDDNQNSQKTIDIGSMENRSSNMDITSVVSKMPIIRRSFQDTIRQSLKLDKIPSSIDASQNNDNLRQKTYTNNNKVNHPDDCSSNTTCASLNVNTSLDPINMTKDVIQKENKKPNDRHVKNNYKNKPRIEPSCNLVNMQQSSALQVNAIESKQITPNNSCIEEEQTKVENILPLNLKTKYQKKLVKPNDLSNELTTFNSNENEQKSNLPVRASMQVNTSLDSICKSSTRPKELNFDKIVSSIKKTRKSDVKESIKNNKHVSKKLVCCSSSSQSSNDESNTSKKQRSSKRKLLSKLSKSNSNLSQSSNEGNKTDEKKNPKNSKNLSKQLIRCSSSSQFSDVESYHSKKLNDKKIKLSAKISKSCSNLLQSSDEENKCLDEKNDSNSKTLESQKMLSSTSNKLEHQINTRKSLRKGSFSKKVQNNESNSVEDEDKLIKEKNSISTNIINKKNLRKSLKAESANSSVVETTPFPASRSFLFKTMIKNNLAMTKRFIESSEDAATTEIDSENEHLQTMPLKKKRRSIYARDKTPSPKLLDTVLVNSSDESSSESSPNKPNILIDETTEEASIKNKSTASKNIIVQSKKKVAKRKLLKENSDLVSFSPAEEDLEDRKVTPKPPTRRRNNSRKKMIEKKIKLIDNKKVEDKKETKKIKNTKTNQIENQNYTSVERDEVNDVENNQYNEPMKSNKKYKKIKSKKFIVKKGNIKNPLEDLLEEPQSSTSNERSSLREFDLKNLKRQNVEDTQRPKNHKIIIVMTGLPKEDKDLIKSVVKALGLAVLELNVTSRTTHVISSGDRTINLLKGILRGCWLLSLEWALKSLEMGKWLDPAPYEMCHFSKAVKENRRDRQLFGKAYVPELFVTCGFIYVENGTSPPTSVLKELIKTAGGRITEDPLNANITIGQEGLREIWVLDSITTGDVQPQEQYKRVKSN
ncbi:MATH and LRR domain-containing protein PFE0570w isoform X1 [Trichogramma pretiosum]|uniref:MATH and LRR domain-containing protein PFE0570w isoform X1 n=2 Tax=Trichogramma pretiosum TaxID=7493 RepID=UPI0006C943B9|nr:MATH and LRR domain-containing protein PFE0570w isoform X1 [Trichogramma pretiosum]